MRFRLVVSVLAFAALATPAGAIPFFPPPQAVYEAPIDRALENVAADTSMEEAQRERLLGRLNLLAYARDNRDFAYLRSDGSFNEAGAIPCSDAPRPSRGISSDAPPPSFAPGEKCAAFRPALGPQPEIPANMAENPGEAARTRLDIARWHYYRAVQLAPGDLRARLGFAYILDRMGREGDARNQLGEILELGLPRVGDRTTDWETYAVLTETVTHLENLPEFTQDRVRMALLKKRLARTQPLIFVTPMVAPLRDAPFDALIDTSSRVAFDFAGTGDRRAQGWLGADAAWLVWDPEGKGRVASGFDMIGARTWAVFWRDGFEVLRALDDDRDGELTGAELGGLALWRDADGDGVSDAGEVRPLRAYGVAGLGVRGEAERRDLITAPAGIRFEDGSTRALYDWTPGLAAAPVS